MSDVHPYPQDITADPFIVFGGLLSRRVVNEYVESLEPSNPEIFQKLVRVSNQCSQEHAFQRSVETILSEGGLPCNKWSGNPRWDRVIEGSFGVEIKLDKHKFDPQYWQGSKGDKNAVEQTRRYLDTCSTYKWSILTNGKVIRIMNTESGFNFLDVWICDTVEKGLSKQATFLNNILQDISVLEELFEKSKVLRKNFNATFEDGVHKFWNKYKIDNDRERNVALVESVLLVGFYRYLEDAGILPTFSSDYQRYRLDKPKNCDVIISGLKKIKNQTFLDSSAPSVNGLITDETLGRISTLLSKTRVYSDFINLFWDEDGAVDLSDLSISFFGDAYQLFAKKTDINGVDGQYFTGSEIARETANYFVEDERRGLAKDEIIFDPFVGSGQLLRALVPYFHILLQHEEREPSIIDGMRVVTKRLAGTDIDSNACWLARLCLTIVTAERNKPLLDLSQNIKKADVFETCFGSTESKWQENLGIHGKVRGIITNPPWRRLRQTSNELYTIETGNPAPLKANKENWAKYQKWLKNGGRDRANQKSEELKKLSAQHRETFSRSGQREVNVAISGLEFVTRLPGVPNKRWVIFIPDCFFIGKNNLRNDKSVNIRKYYSYPYNDHFKDTDSVMKFGVVFGGSSSSNSLYCHPMGQGKVNVKNVFKRLGVLPIYASVEEAYGQSIWFNKAKGTDLWRRGEFDETEEPKKGAKEVNSGGVPVRGAKNCNDKKSHSCIANSDSISRWSGWASKISGSRVIVRDKRSNTKTQKILWAGKHVPGNEGVPKNCALSNGWNYLLGTKKDVRALSALLNTPIADMALRSIGSKRNINPKDLNILGLPDLSDEVKDLLAASDDFLDHTAMTFLLVFGLSKKDSEKILNSCAWISKEEKKEILGRMKIDVGDEAQKLLKTKVKKKRGQIKKAEKRMAQR